MPNATLVDALDTATVLLSGESAHGGEPPLPMALRNPLGRGTVVTVLLEDAPALAEFGVLSHLLARLSADVLPFEVLSAEAGGTDLLGDQLEMMLARASTSWQVTLVNNHGVSKRLREPAVIDASKRVAGVLRLKSGYGTITKALVATEGDEADCELDMCIKIPVLECMFSYYSLKTCSSFSRKTCFGAHEA